MAAIGYIVACDPSEVVRPIFTFFLNLGTFDARLLEMEKDLHSVSNVAKSVGAAICDKLGKEIEKEFLEWVETDPLAKFTLAYEPVNL